MPINYEYIPKYNPNVYKSSLGKLSGGVIAAIVIASVIAILVLIIVTYFARKSSLMMSTAKEINNSKYENSSSNINQ